MKNLMTYFLSISMAFGFFSIQKPAESIIVKAEELKAEVSTNIYKGDYTNYTSPAQVDSYLFDNGNGLTRVEHIDDHVTVEEYSRNLELASARSIKNELSRFCGFYHMPEYNFLIYGDENPQQDDQKEVLRIVKYSNNWQRMSEAKITGSNTTTPVSFGSLRCTHTGNYLYILGCHEMYEIYGTKHQANWRIALDTSSMQVTQNLSGLGNLNTGFVSHSFTPFILSDGNDLIAAEHLEQNGQKGAIVLTKYKGSAGKSEFYPSESSEAVSYKRVVDFPKAPSNYHPNYTGATLGGLVSIPDGYLVTYTFIGSNPDDSSAINQTGLNAYIAYIDKNLQTVKTTKLNSSAGCTTPLIVPISNNQGYILWNKNTGDSPWETNSHYTQTEDLYYRFYTNNQIGPIQQAKAPLSGCYPFLYDGKITWYTTDNGTPAFYQLDSTGVSVHDTNTYWPIRIECNEYGTVTCEKKEGKVGDWIEYHCEPKEHYRIQEFHIVGDSGQEAEGKHQVHMTEDWEKDLFKMLDEPVTIKAVFSYDGGASINYKIEGCALINSPDFAGDGETVTLEASPNNGCSFKSLQITDKNGNLLEYTSPEANKYTFVMPSVDLFPVTVNIVYSFKNLEESTDNSGQENENPDYSGGSDYQNNAGSSDPLTGYWDLDPNAWYAAGVRYVISNKIMTGLNPTTFAPSGTTNRAMIATILYRLEGEPSTGVPNYSDIKGTTYYSNAAAWTQSQGLMTGYADGRFGPSDPISREQMATVLYRYAQYKHKDTSKRSELSEYLDTASVSPFALDAMKWVVSEGIITGTTPYSLLPNGNANRAQVATILERYSKIN